MTPSVALAANAAPQADASTSSSSGKHASDSARSDFSKPLQQARQQHLSQQASSTPDEPRSTSSGSASTSSAASSRDDTHDHDKDDDSSSKNTTPDATAAMLALLGQSVPAQANPTPATAAASDGNAKDAGAVATATSVQTAAITPGLTLLGAAQAAQTQPHADADGDDLVDAMKGDDMKDKALSVTTEDSDATTTPVASAGMPVDAKASLTQVTQGTTTQGDHNDPLDALRAMTAQMMQPGQTAAPATPATPHAMTMQSSAGTPAFAQELGQQVAWLGGQDIKQARIRLHPEDLGQLDVKVTVKQDHVDVSFIAQHPQAVHAVQQTLSQLDAMLAHHGLTLGHAEVGQGGGDGNSSQGASTGSTTGGDAGSSEDGVVASVVAPVVRAIGLLDTFA